MAVFDSPRLQLSTTYKRRVIDVIIGPHNLQRIGKIGLAELMGLTSRDEKAFPAGVLRLKRAENV